MAHHDSLIPQTYVLRRQGPHLLLMSFITSARFSSGTRSSKLGNFMLDSATLSTLKSSASSEDDSPVAVICETGLLFRLSIAFRRNLSPNPALPGDSGLPTGGVPSGNSRAVRLIHVVTTARRRNGCVGKFDAEGKQKNRNFLVVQICFDACFCTWCSFCHGMFRVAFKTMQAFWLRSSSFTIPSTASTSKFFFQWASPSSSLSHNSTRV